MTTYYYDKDMYGREHCYDVDNITEDCKKRLELMGDNASCCVEYIHEGDYAGYSTLAEYIENDGADDWSEAVQEGLDAGLTFPFCVIRHLDGSYETTNESDVDWHELADEYEDFGRWRIQPGYYDSNEMTPDQARKEGMYALAEELERNEENEESEEE